MLEENTVVNNHVRIMGRLDSDFEYSHTSYGEDFYNAYVKVPRLSKITDRIPVTVSERFFDFDSVKESEIVSLCGQFRSYNRFIDGKNRLILTVFAKDFQLISKEGGLDNPNYIFLEGYICKKPKYRTTPFGREITDLLIAVNRAYNKSDYIPCICWGKNARLAKEYQIGDCLKIYGRIQSRKYQKRMEDERTIEKVAYEVSVTKVEMELESE